MTGIHSQFKTERIIFALFLLAALCMPLVQAESGKHTKSESKSSFYSEHFLFCVEPFCGVSFGELGEHLYLNDTSVENTRTSYLQWEENPVFLYGANIEAKLFNIHLNLSASSTFFNVRSGSMYDSDWFMQTNIKQSYSISDEYVQKALNAEAKLGYDFKINSTILLTPYVGASYRYIAFTCPAGGKIWYDPMQYDDNIISYDAPNASYGTTVQIDYWRKSIFTWMGLSCTIQPVSSLLLTFSPAVAPFVRIVSVDHHYNKGGIFFTDKPEGFFCAFEFAAEIAFRLNAHLGLSIHATVLMLSTIHGDTYESNREDMLGDKNPIQNAGASELTGSIFTGIQILF